MKIGSLIILTLLIGSCNANFTFNDDKNHEMNSSEDFDSLDSKSYIGFINQFYFQESNEFYIELYFKEAGIDYGGIIEIASTQDSIIYFDDENQRNRIPDSIARLKFELSGLNTLTLFDENHHNLTEAQFVRVEYLEQNIYSVFIAVYRVDNKLNIEKGKYCIGNFSESMASPNEYLPFTDSILTQEIATQLNFSHDYKLKGFHFQKNSGESVLSIINYDDNVQIVEKIQNEYKSLYKIENQENITEVLLLPILRNDRPILLTKNLLPESDIEWQSILVFDGQNYKPTEKQRIEH